MTFLAGPLTAELVPHCTSVARDGWTGSHDVRPLAEFGLRQALPTCPMSWCAPVAGHPKKAARASVTRSGCSSAR